MRAEKQTRVSAIRKMERGTAARKGVPVRQTRVAERDNDVAVSSSDVKIERNETWCVDPTKRGSNITRAETQLGVANRIEKSPKAFSKENVEASFERDLRKEIPNEHFERRDSKLRRVKRHTFFRVIGGKTDDLNLARKLEPRISGT